MPRSSVMRPLAHDSDTDLLTQLRTGNGHALTELMHRYHAELAAFLIRWTGDHALAEDVLQDVFFRLWHTRDTLAVPHGIRAHLYTATRSRALDLLRSTRRAAVRESHVAIADPVPPANTVFDSDRAAITRAVQRAITTLPPGAQEVWRLCREQHLSYSEAATVLGVTVGTVKTQMSRAFKVVRKAVEGLLVAIVALSS